MATSTEVPNCCLWDFPCPIHEGSIKAFPETVDSEPETMSSVYSPEVE